MAAGATHPFVTALRLRARELARRPVVLTALALQTLVGPSAVVAYLVGERDLTGAGDDLVLQGLRALVVPGGLLFGALVAAVVGSELAWAIERALLARDPRRLRFVALQLAVAGALAGGWWLLEGVVAMLEGVGLAWLSGEELVAPLSAGSHVSALLAALAATVVYGLLGAAAALVFRGALAGVVALLVYGVALEMVLAPAWDRADGWTLQSALARLAGNGDLPVAQALIVAAAFTALALVAATAVYAAREVRD